MHLLVTLSGVILDFELAPANTTDLAVGEELLSAHTDLQVFSDKGYVSQPVAENLYAIQKHHAHTFQGLCAHLVC